MNIHEYQAKTLLGEFGAPISRGVAVLKAEDAEAAAKALGGPIWVVKSQIHAGGRGKGKFKEASAGDKGGVRIAKSVEEVKDFARQMLGATLVTVQTGPHGKQVNRLYIEEGSDIDKEFYLSVLVNRETSEVSFVVSTEGGVNIEDVAHNSPEKIVSFSVDPATGIMAHHGRTVAKALQLTGDLAKQAEKLTTQLYNAFVAKDSFACSTPRWPSTTMRCSAIRTCWRCAMRPRKTPRKSRPPSTISTMSPSTAR